MKGLLMPANAKGSDQMEWNEETIARLRALWAEGLSTQAIAGRMATSKNAVVGKAHRLNLPPRPSPIRRDGAGSGSRPQTPRRVAGPTLPPLASASETLLPVSANEDAGVDALCLSLMPPSPVTGPTLPQLGSLVAAAPVVQGVAVSRKDQPLQARPAATTFRSIRPQACCWPIGEVGTKAFRFCDSEATPGKPYCQEHTSLAYVKVRDRREDADAAHP